MKSRPFFSLPSLGGCLTIAYCLGCLFVYRYGYPHPPKTSPEFLGIAIAWVFAVPFKLLIITERLFPRDESSVWTLAIAVGIDSFLWGYGLAYLGQLLVRWREKKFQFSMLSLIAVATIVAIVLALVRLMD